MHFAIRRFASLVPFWIAAAGILYFFVFAAIYVPGILFFGSHTGLVLHSAPEFLLWTKIQHGTRSCWAIAIFIGSIVAVIHTILCSRHTAPKTDLAGVNLVLCVGQYFAVALVLVGTGVAVAVGLWRILGPIELPNSVLPSGNGVLALVLSAICASTLFAFTSWRLWSDLKFLSDPKNKTWPNIRAMVTIVLSGAAISLMWGMVLVKSQIMSAVVNDFGLRTRAYMDLSMSSSYPHLASIDECAAGMRTLAMRPKSQLVIEGVSYINIAEQLYVTHCIDGKTMDDIVSTIRAESAETELVFAWFGVNTRIRDLLTINPELRCELDQSRGGANLPTANKACLHLPD